MKTIRNSEKAGISSYFAVEILYERIFGHMTTFWVFTHVKIVFILAGADLGGFLRFPETGQVYLIIFCNGISFQIEIL